MRTEPSCRERLERARPIETAEYSDLDPEDFEFADEEPSPSLIDWRELGDFSAWRQRLTEHDSKWARLAAVLEELNAEEPGAKVVVFAFFKKTLRYLEERLKRVHVGCARLDGDVQAAPDDPERDERGKRLQQFRDDLNVRVLLSSEVGDEGIDLQFGHVLVNYDLPWNPMKVEQRIGRPHRPKVQHHYDRQSLHGWYHIGVPVGQLDPTSKLADIYRCIGYCAEKLSYEVVQGIKLSNALDAIRSLTDAPLPPPEESDVQLCPEAQAAIISYLASPAMEPGLYCLIDIGAWTTDISFFRRVKLQFTDDGTLTLEYYAAASHRVAVNDIDERTLQGLMVHWRLEAAEQIRTTPSLRAQREKGQFGKHDFLIGGTHQRPPESILHSARESVRAKILACFRETIQEARRKEPFESAWNKLRIFVVGGGAAERVLWRDIARDTPVARSIDLLPSLELSKTTAGEVGPTYAVALGLAIPSALWPRVFLPSAVPPVLPRPIRERPSFEDLGYGK